MTLTIILLTTIILTVSLSHFTESYSIHYFFESFITGILFSSLFYIFELNKLLRQTKNDLNETIKKYKNN